MLTYYVFTVSEIRNRIAPLENIYIQGEITYIGYRVLTKLYKDTCSTFTPKSGKERAAICRRVKKGKFQFSRKPSLIGGR